MTTGKAIRPFTWMNREVRRVQEQLIEDLTADDLRLTEAQLHRGVIAILQGEPILFLAAYAKRAMSPTSKVQVEPEVIRKMMTDIHDRLYPMPDRLQRKRSSENQFELEFMWSTPDGGERVAIAQFEKVEDGESDRR